MDFDKITDSESIISFNFTCPFCFKKFIVKKLWKYRKNVNIQKYDFPNEDNYCEHLLLWKSSDSELDCTDEINNLEWFTRSSNLPFRVWDVLQEIINNDDLPEGCEVRIRAFYDKDLIVFVFGNNSKILADVVLEKTKEQILKYKDQYPLDKEDCKRFLETAKSLPIQISSSVDFTEIEDVYKKLEGELERDDFKSKVEEKIYLMNGLCDPRTAALLVASDFGFNDPMKSKNRGTKKSQKVNKLWKEQL